MTMQCTDIILAQQQFAMGGSTTTGSLMSGGDQNFVFAVRADAHGVGRVSKLPI